MYESENDTIHELKILGSWLKYQLIVRGNMSVPHTLQTLRKEGISKFWFSSVRFFIFISKLRFYNLKYKGTDRLLDVQKHTKPRLTRYNEK